MRRPEAAGGRRPGLPPLPRLARTVTFKLALLQAALFAATAAVLFATVYASFVGYASDQLRAAVAAEYDALAENRAGEGQDDLVGLVASRMRGSGAEGFRYLVRGADGRRLAGDLPDSGLVDGWQDIRVARPAGGQRAGPQRLEVHAGTLPTGEFVAVGRDTGDLSHIKAVVVRSFGGAAALALFVAIGSGIITSLGALRRVEAINGITRGIMEGDLGRRVPERGTGDEFDRLARNTNAMLERIQILMEGMRQVSSDIAHDLRTPLTHLRQRLEAARGRATHGRGL